MAQTGYDILNKEIDWSVFIQKFPETSGIIENAMCEYAIEILKYNLKRYKQQVFEFNTGDATKFKSIDDITFETIKELENK